MPNTKNPIRCLSLLIFLIYNAINTNVVADSPTRNDSVHYVSARIIYNTYAQISWTTSELPTYDDFESGDFSWLNWNNAISDYPWTIDSTQAYQGNYCMKSSNHGHGNSISEIEIAYFIPTDDTMSFYSKISSEPTFDVGRFYIDGEKQLECSGESDWVQYHFGVTQGIHWFRWSFYKDTSIDNGDDCFYVDQISFVDDGKQGERDLLYFNLYRRCFEEEPIVLASHLTDSSFIDMSWSSLPWGQYSWGVSCTYSGEPPIESEISWSNIIDKEMTTTLEVNATTNTGTTPTGATVIVEPYTGQGDSYSASLDENGHVLFSDIYRGSYTIRVHLDGYLDHISDTAVSILAPTIIDLELQERTYNLDTLYVSSTGWAIWEAENMRSLQYYEIALNGNLLGSSNELHYQFDTDTLIEGNTYQAAVRPVFESGAGTWITYDWVYRSCHDFPSSIDLEGTITEEGTLISWTYPEADSLLGAVFFREDDYNGLRYLGFTTDNSFIDTQPYLGPGLYQWHVRIVYGGQNNDYYSMSCPESVMIYIPLGCDAPELLRGETYYTDDNDYGALISWGPRPLPIEGWLYYDNGIYHRSIGSDDGVIFWGIKFEPTDLINYIGCSLTQISLYDVEAGTYQLFVYQGGTDQPGNIVYCQNLELEGTHGWHTIATDSPISITTDEPLWVIIGQQGIAYPAAVCTEAGTANGRWVSLDGTHWQDLASYNLNFTWMLRAFVTDQVGRLRQLNEEGALLIGYNLYRSSTGYDYTFLTQIPYVEGEDYYEYRDNLSEMPEQTYYYQLTAIYDDGCESEPATSADNPEIDYVEVEASWQVEDNAMKGFTLYPNPTSGNIVIEARGMKRISITDAMGQEIAVYQVHTDMLTIDLTSLADGLYLISVLTEGGNSTKAFMLAR